MSFQLWTPAVDIIRLRFGLEGRDPLTLEEVVKLELPVKEKYPGKQSDMHAKRCNSKKNNFLRKKQMKETKSAREARSCRIF